MSHTQCLIAACGGDTVKLFDVSVETGDPCSCQYSPSQGSQVNSVKWNHTNLVVASAGEDRKISLWMKNGQNLGGISHSGTDTGDNINESILAISFSSKGSRYLCSGGTGKVVRIWDMQRKRCIKWLKGHTDTITGVTYNSKDEHLASISVKGDLILHNLASGTRAAELKDPHGQVLRVLESSRLSRHLLVTAGDDGSIHLWDTTGGRNPKVSWIRQHSAPTTGVAFSPCNDKMIISVGLDKKLYTFDPGMRKAVHCIPSEAPFSSLAFKDDGLILAAGTNSGRVVFYDVRGKPQPFTILRAYGASEAVTSLCWQRSNPIPVNEASCTLEVALLGVTGEDSVLMPDPLPASNVNTHGRTVLSSFPVKTSGRSSLTAADISSASGINATVGPASSGTITSEETDFVSANPVLTKGSFLRLQTPRTSCIIKDDMEVFSPLVDVQPITPSVSTLWDSNDDLKGDSGVDRKVAWGPTPPGNIRRFPSIEELKDENQSHAEHRSPSLQEDMQAKSCPSSPVASTPISNISPKADRSPSVTPPEVWGGDSVADKVTVRAHTMSRFASRGLVSGSNSLSSRVTTTNAADTFPRVASDNLNLGGISTTTSSENSVSDPTLTVPNRMAYSERTLISRSILSSTGELPPVSSGGSPRQKKLNAEKIDDHSVVEGNLEGRKEVEIGHVLRSDAGSLTGATSISSNGHLHLGAPRSSQQEPPHQGPPSFALQLVQRTLEESLGAVQKAIHDDVQNLHLELLRQFHISQTEMVGMMDGFLLKQTEMMDEIQALRRENQQLRNLF